MLVLSGHLQLYELACYIIRKYAMYAWHLAYTLLGTTSTCMCECTAACGMGTMRQQIHLDQHTEAFCFLVLKGNFRLQQKYLGFNSDTQEISENDIRHSTDFVDIGGKPLIKKSVREESSVSNGLTDQWTDDLLVNYKEIYTGLSQKNRYEYGRTHTHTSIHKRMFFARGNTLSIQLN